MTMDPGRERRALLLGTAMFAVMVGLLAVGAAHRSPAEILVAGALVTVLGAAPYQLFAKRPAPWIAKPLLALFRPTGPLSRRAARSASFGLIAMLWLVAGLTQSSVAVRIAIFGSLGSLLVPGIWRRR
jgi:hypothetical protein